MAKREKRKEKGEHLPSRKKRFRTIGLLARSWLGLRVIFQEQVNHGGAGGRLMAARLLARFQNHGQGHVLDYVEQDRLRRLRQLRHQVPEIPVVIGPPVTPILRGPVIKQALRVHFETIPFKATVQREFMIFPGDRCGSPSTRWPSLSTALYVANVVEPSRDVARQAGAALGKVPRLAAKVAAPSQRSSPNGCKGRKSRIARLGKQRDEVR